MNTRRTCHPGAKERFGAQCYGLGKPWQNVESVRQECDRDSQQWCKETISGSGNLLSCFLRAQQVMSPQCKAAIYSVWDKRGQRG
jgi:hypothetical protein